MQVTTWCHHAEPRRAGKKATGVTETSASGDKRGADDGQNPRGLRTVGAVAPLSRGLPGPQRHLRGAHQLLPAVLLHPGAPRAGGRARGDRPGLPGHVPLPQEEASEEEDPARPGGIRARPPQPRARGAREAVRHRPTGEARGATLVPGRGDRGRRGRRGGGSNGRRCRRLLLTVHLVPLQGTRLWNKTGKAIRHKELTAPSPPRVGETVSAE